MNKLRIAAMTGVCGLTLGLVPALSAVSAHAEETTGRTRAAGPHCDPGWAVKVQRKVKYKKSTGERDELINKTSRSIKRTYSLTKQSTSKWNVSAEANVQFKAWIFSQVDIKVGGSLEKSSSITTTQTDELTVRPHRTVVVTRGFRQMRVYGNTYYTWSNCATGKYKSFTLSAPYSKYLEAKEVRN